MSELKPLEDIAKQIANMVGMPYCWEDIASRLADGKPLPFKLGDSWNTRPGLKARLVEARGKSVTRPGRP